MDSEDKEFEDMTSEEAVELLVGQLPAPVQNFLASPERSEIARELSQKYNLHVDQAGEFERAYLFMLLGIATPEEFTASLRKTGLTQDVINGLSEDINTRVFMRLRDAERNGTAPAPFLSQKPVPLPPPALDYQPAVPTLPGSPVAAPMPVPAPPPAPVQEVAPAPQAIIPQQHFVHSMPNTQPQSGWHPAAAVHIFVPTHTAQQPQVAPIQQAQEVVPTYTQAPEPVAPAPVPPVEEVPAYVPPASVPVTPQVKKVFGTDPYREPIQ